MLRPKAATEVAALSIPQTSIPLISLTSQKSRYIKIFIITGLACRLPTPLHGFTDRAGRSIVVLLLLHVTGDRFNRLRYRGLGVARCLASASTCARTGIARWWHRLDRRCVARSASG